MKKREDERKRKAEERTKKAEQRAREKARKEEEQARKAEQRAQQTVGKGKQPKRAGTKRKGAGTDHCITSKMPGTDADSFNENECCVCFVSYKEDILDQSGKDWVGCACGQWLHEDCAEDCVLDSNGMERLCPLCLV